jgi:tRNA pseudouridine55 synthase
LNEVDLTDAMTKLSKRQRQQPPAFSAKKVGGERAYKLARRGEQPDIEEVDVEVLSFAATGWDGPNLQFETHVSSGTYVRALARDLGTMLGCGAHLAELRRTAVGPFSVDDAPRPEEVSPAHIRPALEAVAHLRSIAVDGADLESLVHGRAITAPEPLSGSVALVAGDELVAVAEAQGTQLRPRVVFAS